MYVGFADGTDTTGTLVDENDVPFTKERVGPIALRELRTNTELPAAPGDHVHKIRDDAPPLYMRKGEQLDQ
jgi:hypothetical protein